MKSLKKGDEVTWHYGTGTAHGKVEQKLTSEKKIGSYSVKASHDEPQYLVKTPSGKLAAHKPSSLHKA